VIQEGLLKEETSGVKMKAQNQNVKDKKLYDIQKNLSPVSSKVDKENIFYKIGLVLIKVGVIILSVGGGVIISSGGGFGGIQIYGLLLGLAVIILALPFFLLAVITTQMKKNSSPDKLKGYYGEI
jgi:hypothetical protein